MAKYFFLFIVIVSLTGCPIDGDTGKGGINCWDVNGNHFNDSEEDINGDGKWDAKDCSAINTNSTQNLDVALNHQHICEALANLGQYPTGCPSDSHTTPTGTLTQINALIDSGSGYAVSCALEPDNGLLSVIPKNNGFYWSLDGGYIAKQTTIDALDELDNNACFNLCQADSKCIASWASSELTPPVTSYTCHIFYHSDTVSPWERHCAQNIEDCAAASGALSTSSLWSTMCP